jgi:hypothetical protein
MFDIDIGDGCNVSTERRSVLAKEGIAREGDVASSGIVKSTRRGEEDQDQALKKKAPGDAIQAKTPLLHSLSC